MHISTTTKTTTELLEIAEKLSADFNKSGAGGLQALADLCKATLERQKNQDARMEALEQEIRRMHKLQAKTILGGPKNSG